MWCRYATDAGIGFSRSVKHLKVECFCQCAHAGTSRLVSLEKGVMKKITKYFTIKLITITSKIEPAIPQRAKKVNSIVSRVCEINKDVMIEKGSELGKKWFLSLVKKRTSSFCTKKKTVKEARRVLGEFSSMVKKALWVSSCREGG